MTNHAEIFVDIKSHIESGRFIRDSSSNKRDVREFAFSDVDLRDCKNILDLGCGYGYFVKGLAGRVHPKAHIVGIDLWEGGKKLYLNACRDAGFSGEFIASDVSLQSKKFADQCFDLVLCSYTLYFFSSAIQEIARILRPEGLFISVTHTVPHMQELVTIVKELLEKDGKSSVQSLPLENLFKSFSNVNGSRLLSQYFHTIREKHYSNYLLIDNELLPRLINYLCFKRPKFFPREYGIDEHYIKTKVADYMSDLLARQKSLKITKDDTVFISQYPMKE